ncbi:MAG TPA: TonB-dependent receptor [Steroidobacter sp.]|uniref:TonB-dependent receptor n=1 Tax=Steroidobacter sp. TaxID=1978227 RepID=UPI002EDBAD00
MRLSVLAAAISLSVGLSTAADVQAAIKKRTFIPAQGLGPALRAFAKDHKLQIIYVSEEVAKLHTRGVVGDVTSDEALRALLQGTELEYRYLDERTVTVFLATEAESTQSTSALEASEGLRLSQASNVSSSTESTLALEEVIVTATKRPEAVRRISGSVSALTGNELEKVGAQSMADYISRTPGVIFNGSAPGNSTVTIRGISTTTRIDQGQGTTGYFLDDVPLTDPFFSIAIPDIDAFDVNNVSVLRGPQGTLFGSASLGGAINYQTAKPDASKWDARVQGSYAGVTDGGDSQSGKVMINAPIVTDKLAVRGVYVYRDDAGFLDNVGTARDDVDRVLVRGGRVQALWAPTDRTKVNYLFLNQTLENDDVGYQEPETVGNLQKSTVVPERSEYETTIHNLRVDQEFDFGTLTVSAAHHEKRAESTEDATADLESLLPGVSPITISAPSTSRGKTFEIRLASPTGRSFEYLIGAMRDDTHMDIRNLAGGPGTAAVIEELFAPLLGPGIGEISAPGDIFLNARIPVHGEENALFGEATYHFNDAWKVTLGGRGFDTKVENATESSGFFTLLTTGELQTSQSGTQKERGFTPKASITWTPSDDFMAYVLASKGFRYGGPNIIVSEPGFTVPPEFDSDSLFNYELGVRSDLFGQRVRLDGTVFFIDWRDIQLRQQTPLRLNYASNAGKAESYGLEGTATIMIARDLVFTTNLTYLNAELVEDFNPGGGQQIVPAGSTLPGASEWQVSSTLSYEMSELPLAPSFVLSHRYLSEAPGIFGAGAEQGDFSVVDARVALRFNQFSITAFVNNLTNSDGVTTALDDPLQQYLIRPRTIGVTLDYRL